MDLPAPMKATAGPLPQPDEGWAYEIKWDGMRVVVGIDDEGVHAVSTNGIDVVPRFPELDGLAEHLAGHRVILDGEIVAFDGDRTDFGTLQRRMHLSSRAEALRQRAATPVWFMAFDLLHLDGIDTTSLPYADRRRLLASLVEDGPSWKVPAHRVGDGAALLEAASAANLEGLVAKRLTSTYQPGRRSQSWRKLKIRRRQEFVVGGYTAGEGSRSRTFGAVLVGYHAEPGDGILQFAGAVGSGFDDATATHLRDLLDERLVPTSPFGERLPPTVRGPVWTAPEVVVEVDYGEWTADGRLRHPSFAGLRFDTDPASIGREPTA